MGITNIHKFLAFDEKTILAGEGFGKASAKKLVDEIEKARKGANIVQWAVGSGIFGRGIGTKRTELAFHIVPKDLVAKEGLVEAITEIPGWSKESAEGFVANLPNFRRFMEGLGIKPKSASPVKAVSNGKFKGQVVLFTGFHPKDLEAALVAQGGELADTFGKKVTMLVVKDAGVSNEKTKKALAAGIPVKTADEFKAML